MTRESMEYDVVIVGAGPAGLSAACRLKQIEPELSVCVLEKGAEIGAHILSGAIFEPRALDELFPDWRESNAPLTTPVLQDEIYYLANAANGISVPTWAAPFTLRNHGNYIISLGNLCRWLGERAESLGVDIFAGFAAADVVFDQNDTVTAVITGDQGLDRQGQPKPHHAPGMELRGKYLLLAEGCRGHLGKKIIAHYQLDTGCDPQHYALGVKELWQIPADRHQAGLVVHTAGWPLNESGSSGGGFLYHLDGQQVVVGLITDLSYSNPHVSPFDEFQRYKHHPQIAHYLQGGKRLGYGARAIAKGGLQSQPRMAFPGGLLIGDDAGTLNFAKLKGSHTAMKCGMVAAEVVAAALAEGRTRACLDEFHEAYRTCWAWSELHTQRNFGPAQQKWGNLLGSIYSFFDLNLARGSLPWTLRARRPDYASLRPAASCRAPVYPAPDGRLSFDRATSVHLANLDHDADQPCHLQLADQAVPAEHNFPLFGEPAQHYCPAGVYELEHGEAGPRLRINAQNCVHCKTCDIKDPAQNITWVTPEGGSGPCYLNM